MRVRDRVGPNMLLAAFLAMPVAACTAAVTGTITPHPRPAVSPAPSHPVPLLRPLNMNGILIGLAGGNVPRFERATGTTVSLSASYVTMTRPLPLHYMRWAETAADGARPVIEILPYGTTLAAIAAGHDDGWLLELKIQLNEPVVVSFAPEADALRGHPWAGHPAAYRAAWRHVVRIIGRHDITWMWQQSAHCHCTGGLRSLWPGHGIVGWAGLDGYFYHPSDTFTSVFGKAISNVRELTRRPLLLSETSAGPVTRHAARDVTSLFAGVRADHLLGLIWFDVAQHAPPWHQDWNLETRPAVLAAFRRAATATRG